MLPRSPIGPALIIGIACSTAPAGGIPGGTSEVRIPEWAGNARWYYAVVPRYHNGDKSNDPHGTLPWTGDWLTQSSPEAEPGGRTSDPLWAQLCTRRYGGDLEGLGKRLAYLKRLGINALILSPVYHGATEYPWKSVDMRHVDDSLGVKDGMSRLAEENDAPHTWRLSASDKLFVDFVKEAHKQGFRIALRGLFWHVGQEIQPLGNPEEFVVAVTRRWMDPNGDGDTTDGIDAWVLDSTGKFEKGFWEHWRALVKAINPEAMVIGNLPDGAANHPEAPFDLVVNGEVSRHVQRFFRPERPGGQDIEGTYTLQKFFDDLSATNAHVPAEVRRANLNAWDAMKGTRLLQALASGSQSAAMEEPSAPGPVPDKRAVENWRLATVFQHFYPGAPVTFYGEEVGMYGKNVFGHAPMWWNDLADADAESPNYRGDFLALTRLLNQLRERFEPLRGGDFRPLTLDEQRKVLAFRRSLPGDEVTLVMNYGDAEQQVTLSVGWPAQMVTVLTPQLKPGRPNPSARRRPGSEDQAGIPRLEIGGNRHYTDNWGDITLSVKAKSVRIVVVQDKGISGRAEGR